MLISPIRLDRGWAMILAHKGKRAATERARRSVMEEEQGQSLSQQINQPTAEWTQSEGSAQVWKHEELRISQSESHR